MKLEEAITWLNNLFFDFKELGNDYTLVEEDLDAAHTLISHAEATRWRNLEEEKPEEDGTYEVGMWGTNFGKKIWITDHAVWSGVKGIFFYCQAYTHWRPIVPPEDSE